MTPVLFEEAFPVEKPVPVQAVAGSVAQVSFVELPLTIVDTVAVNEETVTHEFVLFDHVPLEQE